MLRVRAAIPVDIHANEVRRDEFHMHFARAVDDQCGVDEILGANI